MNSHQSIRSEQHSPLILIDKKTVFKTVLKFAAAHDPDREHYVTVARLSCALFDGFTELHGLGNYERFLLECGAVMHDVGNAFGTRAHNKTAYEMIVSSPYLRIIDKHSRLIMGLIARYHRKTALPHSSHVGFSMLDAQGRSTVVKLASLVRIADGLDTMHKGPVAALTCSLTDKKAAVNLFVTSGVKNETAKALEKADLFRKTFHVSFDITSKPV